MTLVKSTPVLAVAVDVPSAAPALALAAELAALPVWLKVGLELFTAEGPALVKAFLDQRAAVFLDLKFHDIPNTVRGAVRSATTLGVHMTTLHLAGGEAMCRAAVTGREEGMAGRKSASRPLLMGITVLTSDGAGQPQEAVTARVVERALAAKSYGLDGIVCSGHEAAAVKAACGNDFLCLCPGIRFAGTAGGDDQARVCTPAQAVARGADFLVMGRPVTTAPNPAEAARRALEEMGALP